MTGDLRTATLDEEAEHNTEGLRQLDEAHLRAGPAGALPQPPTPLPGGIVTMSVARATMSDVSDDLAPTEQALASQPGSRLAVYRLALAESRTAFDDLMGQPEKIRRNVIALLGFAGVALSALGFVAGRPLHVLEWITQSIAGVGVIGLVGCSAFVSFPRKLIPSMDAGPIIGWGDEGDTEERAVKSLALGLEENYSKNLAVIRTMFKAQIAAAICFGITVIALAVRMLGV